MFFEIIKGCLIPFFGTALGAACVFFVKGGLGNRAQSAFAAFAAGVMAAASVWSLIIPAVEMSQNLGHFAFLPMLCGLWLGVLFLIWSERLLSSKEKSTIHNCVLYLNFKLNIYPKNLTHIPLFWKFLLYMSFYLILLLYQHISNLLQ